jgi:hypothetical protein
MMLALTGAAVPAVINDNKVTPKVEVAAAKPGDGPAVLRVLPARPDPALLDVVAVGAGKSTAPSAESAAADQTSAAADPASGTESRNRLFPRFGRTPNGSGNENDTRQRLLRPPGDDGSGSDGGILPGTRVGDVVASVLGTVEDVAASAGLDLAEAVPVGVTVTAPALDGTSTDAAPLGVAVTGSLPESPVVDGVVDPVTGLLAPVTGRLGISIK